MSTTAALNDAHLMDETLRWLASLKTAAGCYRVTKEGETSLFTSCAAIFIMDLFGALDGLTTEERSQWIDRLRGWQDPVSGYFGEHAGGISTPAEPYWEPQYVQEEAAQFCTMALAALGSTPLYPLPFAREPHTADDVVRSLAALDWRDPWYQSNKVMFRLTLLLDDHRRTGDPRPRDAAHRILDWLDSWQDPATGLWGTDKGSSRYHAAFAAFHFVFFYFYLNRPLKHMPALIDAVLSLQNRRDGLFSPHGGGGACQDLDAVDLLVKCGMACDHRAQDVRDALDRAFKGLLRTRTADNGFCWSPPRSFTPGEWLRSIPRLLNTTSVSRGLYPEFMGLAKTHFTARGFKIKHCGLDYLSYQSTDSNVFSTWFRLLALALIDTRYPENRYTNIAWHFPVGPGLGWHSTDIGSRKDGR